MKIFGYLIIILCSVFSLSVSTYAEDREKGNAVAEKFSNRFAGAPFKITEKGFFKVAVISSTGGFKAGENTADIIVHDKKDTGVTNAKITIIPWMPDMGHGSPIQPVITDKGGGMFGAENIVFIMGGYWELRMKIIKDGVEDTVVFTFPDVKEE